MGDQVNDFEPPDQTGAVRTFVIDTDRTVLDVIASELSMDSHADEALEVLRSR